MKFSFNTFNSSTYYGLDPSLPAQIRAAAEAGYDHIGLDLLSVLAHERNGIPVTELAQALERHRLPCYELVSLSISADRNRTRASLADILRTAEVLRPREVLCVVSGVPGDAVVANAAECAQALARQDIGLSLEFLPTHDIDSIGAAIRLLDRVDHPNLRLVMDSWHFFRGPSTWAELEALPVERIGFVQFGDAPEPLTQDMRDECMHRRVPPGEGVLGLRRFCELLTAKGFDGVVSTEVLSRRWRHDDVREFARVTLKTTHALWNDRAHGVAVPEPADSGRLDARPAHDATT